MQLISTFILCLAMAILAGTGHLRADSGTFENTYLEKQTGSDSNEWSHTPSRIEKWLSKDKNRKKLKKTLLILGTGVAVLVVGSRAANMTLNRFLLPASNTRLPKKQAMMHKKLMESTRRFMNMNPNFQGWEVVESVNRIKGRKTKVLNILPPHQTRPNGGCIIYFPGKGAFYQNRIDELVELSAKTGMPLIAANYPKGIRTSNDLFAWSTKFASKTLGSYDPSKSVIMGQSMGGAVATYTTVKLRRQGFLVSLLTDRSFASLSKAGVQKTFFNHSWASRILKWVNWEMEPVELIHKIPPGKQAHFYSDLDQLIKKDGNTKVYKKLFHNMDIFHIHHRKGRSKSANHHNDKIYEFVIKDSEGQEVSDVIPMMDKVIKKMIDL